MAAPRHFATSNSPFQNRRSVLSPAVPASQVDTDFTTEDPRVDYVAGQRLPEPAPASGLAAALAVIAHFGREARNAFPDLNPEVFLVEKTDARGTAVPQWGVRVTGPALGAARPSTQAATPADAIRQLKALVGVARRGAKEQRTAAALERSQRAA